MSRALLFAVFAASACATTPRIEALSPPAAPLPFARADGLWSGLAAMEALDPDAAGRAWSEEILARPEGPRAVAAAALLTQLEAPFRARHVRRALRGSLSEGVRARLAWTGVGEGPTHWVPTLRARRQEAALPAWTARVEPGGRLRVGGGSPRGRFVVQTCAQFEERTKLSAWLWSSASGELALDGRPLWTIEGPSVERSVELDPGLHRLSGTLQVDAEDDAVAIWWPGWAERSVPCPSGGEEAHHRVRAPRAPEPSAWPERFIAARVAEAGVDAWPERAESLLAPVPRLARSSPAWVGAWARWALGLDAPAPRVLEVLDDEQALTRWGLFTRVDALASVDPRRAKRLMSSLDAPEASFRLLLALGEEREALALAHRLRPERMSTAERAAAYRFFARAAWPRKASELRPSFDEPLAEARWLAEVDLEAARRRLAAATLGLEGRLQAARWAWIVGDEATASAAMNALLREAPAWAPVLRLRRRMLEARDAPLQHALAPLRAAGELRLDWELSSRASVWRPPLPFAPRERLGPAMKAERGAGEDRVIVADRRIEDWLAGGGRLVTTHILERVQTRGGIDAVGQVAPPPDAVVLQVRTLEADGAAHPAEAADGLDLSFVDLDPMDGAEIEWVRAESAPIDEIATRFAHRGPNGVEFSELVIRTPPEIRLEWMSLHGAPEPTVEAVDGRVVYRWHMEDVPPWREEPHGPPPRELLPITLVWLEGASERARAQNLQALRLKKSPWATELGRRLAGADEPIEGLRRVFSWVRDEIEPGAEVGASALLQGRGDRTRLLAQLTRSLGGRLALGRETPRWPSLVPDPRRYDIPLVVADTKQGRIWMGFDGPSSWFGRLPASFQGGSYLNSEGQVRVVAPSDVGPEHLDVLLRLRLDEEDAQGTMDLQVQGRWQGRLDAILDEAGVDEIEAQLERGLSEAFGAVDVSIWTRTANGLRAEFVASRLFTREGRTLRMRRLGATPMGEILLGLPGPEALIQPARRQTELVVEPRSERLRIELELPVEAVLQPPSSFARSAGWGRFLQRFEEGPGTFALERGWAWASVRVPPEEMPSFVAAMERLIDDMTHELGFVLERR